MYLHIHRHALGDGGNIIFIHLDFQHRVGIVRHPEQLITGHIVIVFLHVDIRNGTIHSGLDFCTGLRDDNFIVFRHGIPFAEFQLFHRATLSGRHDFRAFRLNVAGESIIGGNVLSAGSFGGISIVRTLLHLKDSHCGNHDQHQYPNHNLTKLLAFFHAFISSFCKNKRII